MYNMSSAITGITCVLTSQICHTLKTHTFCYFLHSHLCAKCQNALERTYTNAEMTSTWHNQDTTCTMHFFALYRVTVSIYLNSPTSNFLVCYRFWLALITLDLVIIEVKAKNKNKNFGFVFFLLWIFHQELICALHQP